MNEIIIGIDLGTTNSEVAIVQNGKLTVIPIDGQKILPSAVSLADDNALLVGETAKNQYVLYPERTVLSIKRKMGSTEKVILGEKSFTPQEISALILKRLKRGAEEYLQSPVTKAVITVPAYFSDAQRQATREAGELAGLEVVRMINEPTAAALAYDALNNEQKRVLVYDLGGGTFDVSIVSLQSQVVEVLASTGNNHLGGDDFDAIIVDFIDQHLKTQGIEAKTTTTRARIKRAAEIAKIALSDHPFAVISEEYLLDFEGKPYHLSLELSREKYEEMISPYIDETLSLVHTALDDAKFMTSDINEILLVGGSSRTPVITRRLAELFDCSPRFELDPELCVAMGAAIQAGIIAGEKCDSVLVDITPYTFGTSCIGMLHGTVYPNVFQPLILKNTPIPVSKSEVFATFQDFQEAVEVNVFQGEDEDALENIKIGQFLIEGLSHVPAGNQIILSFKLDVDGILHVSAKEKNTGYEKNIRINNALPQLDQEEMAQAKQRIDDLFQNEGLEGLASNVNQEHSKALQLIQKAEKALDIVSGEDQEDLINMIEIIKDILNANEDKKDKLSQHLEKLSDILFYLEIETA